MSRSLLLCLAGAALIASRPSTAQLGHEVDDLRNRVTVSGQQQWGHWSFPHGTIAVTEEGVRPAFWRKQVNASSEILDNLRLNPPAAIAAKLEDEITLQDAIQGASNEAGVVNVFDADMETFWEPDPAVGLFDLGLQWRFRVDMGRLVMADKVVLRFVDEALGDPFLLFDVFVSDGQKPVSNLVGNDVEFTRVFRTLQPNKGQRVFEIDVAALATTDPRKRLIRFVEVAVTGSDQARGREVGESEYERLRVEAPADTGLVEHTKLLQGGGLLAVSAGDWERLDEERRGPVHYFHRERPRLAELEVWSEGDDLFSDILRREGSVLSVVEIALPNMVDHNLVTKARFALDPLTRGGSGRFDDFVVDIGSQFWIDSYRHVLVPVSEGAASFGQWALDFSDGAREADGSLAWTRKHSIQEEPQELHELLLERVDFEPIRARFMRIQYFAHQRFLFLNAFMSALQLYGRGYQPETILRSDAITFPESTNLISISWEASTPSGTSVQLQTRTGTALDQEYCFYKRLGGAARPLVGNGDSHCAVAGSDEAAALAARFEKPGAGAKPDRIDTLDFIDESKFSPWSEVYTEPSGSAITSPSPRPVLLIQATLISDNPDEHATLKSVTVNFGDPVANRLVGTLTPNHVESLGVDHKFALVVQLDTLQLGPDELLLVAPAGMTLLRDPAPLLYQGTMEQLTHGQDTDAVMLPVNVLLPIGEAAVGDSLHLSFDFDSLTDDLDSTAEAIRLEFTGRLFSSGGRLQAQLRNSQRGGANWQQVDQDRSSLVLLALPQQKTIFSDLQLVPAVFTPNGDDRNDQTIVSFSLLSVGTGTGVEVEVYDLSGRLVRRLREARDNSAGPYRIPWDGRNAAGDLVAPGMYAMRLKLVGSTAGSGLDQIEALRSVAVAY
jgi:hypothetical protein